MNFERATQNYTIKDFYEFRSIRKIKSGMNLAPETNLDVTQFDDDENKLGEINSSIIARTSSGNIIVEGQHKMSNIQVAIKIISKKDKSVTEIEAIRDFIKMYQIAQHYYVVKLEDYFENRDNFHLCLELHSKQTLYEYISENILEEKKARELAHKILLGLEHMHKHGIILKNFCARGVLMTDVTKDRHLPTIPRICHLSKAEIMGYDQ